jgi:dTDP-4-dehydrorhamnose 3,5-epimerase-like enzyme
MPPEQTSLLRGRVRVLDLERFRDHRGSLTPLTLDDLGFRVARTFVVSAPRGAVRGGHAHRRVRQVLFRASGTIDVAVSHGGEHARITLDEERPALLIEQGVWAEQTYLDEGATLIVFADGPYDASEYERPDAVEPADAAEPTDPEASS